MEQFVVWADAHEGLAAWVQAAGSIIAIIAAFLVPILMARTELMRRRKLAAMKVTTRMWRWIRVAQQRVYAVEDWQPELSEEPKCELPSLPFSTSLENVVELPPRLAYDLLGLVDRRRIILSEVAATSWFENSINAQPAFVGQSAELIFATEALLQEIAQYTDWKPQQIDPRDRKKLAKIIEDFQAAQARTKAEDF
jgi:hypothetical protein